MTYKFTNRANKAIEIANDLALELGHSYIGTEHILYGLAKEGGGVASKVLENQNITADELKENRGKGYTSTSVIGKSGLEKEYEEIENFVYELDIKNGYMQDLGEHEEEYVPKWEIK